MKVLAPRERTRGNGRRVEDVGRYLGSIIHLLLRRILLPQQPVLNRTGIMPLHSVFAETGLRRQQAFYVTNRHRVGLL